MCKRLDFIMFLYILPQIRLISSFVDEQSVFHSFFTHVLKFELDSLYRVLLPRHIVGRHVVDGRFKVRGQHAYVDVLEPNAEWWRLKAQVFGVIEIGQVKGHYIKRSLNNK